jgi:hypothetical protein
LSGSRLVLPGGVLRRAAWAEAAIRGAIVAAFATIAVDAEPVVRLIIAAGAAYHGLAILRLLSPIRPGAASLTLDRAGFTLRLMWRDRRVAWSAVHAIGVQAPRYFAGQRAGVLVTLGDAKGPTDLVLIPPIFAPGPHELVAEIGFWRGS